MSNIWKPGKKRPASTKDDRSDIALRMKKEDLQKEEQTASDCEHPSESGTVGYKAGKKIISEEDRTERSRDGKFSTEVGTADNGTGEKKPKSKIVYGSKTTKESGIGAFTYGSRNARRGRTKKEKERAYPSTERGAKFGKSFSHVGEKAGQATEKTKESLSKASDGINPAKTVVNGVSGIGDAVSRGSEKTYQSIRRGVSKASSGDSLPEEAREAASRMQKVADIAAKSVQKGSRVLRKAVGTVLTLAFDTGLTVGSGGTFLLVKVVALAVGFALLSVLAISVSILSLFFLSSYTTLSAVTMVVPDQQEIYTEDPEMIIGQFEQPILDYLDLRISDRMEVLRETLEDEEYTITCTYADYDEEEDLITFVDYTEFLKEDDQFLPGPLKKADILSVYLGTEETLETSLKFLLPGWTFDDLYLQSEEADQTVRVNIEEMLEEIEQNEDEKKVLKMILGAYYNLGIQLLPEESVSKPGENPVLPELDAAIDSMIAAEIDEEQKTCDITIYSLGAFYKEHEEEYEWDDWHDLNVTRALVYGYLFPRTLEELDIPHSTEGEESEREGLKGYEEIVCYGAAFFQKQVKVKLK